MATRLYFPASTAAQVTPVANGSWGYTSEALNRKLVPTTKSNTALADGTQIGPWTAGQTALDRRYVSPPLSGNQSISGTVKCYLMAREFATSDNTTSRFEIYVVHNDGQTVRGTCLAIGQYGPATELINNATLRNKAFADGDTITTVSALDGDRIVVCIGYSDASGSTPEGQAKYGDPTSGTDLGENETNTTANPGWVEFSGNFTFQTGTTFEGVATLSGTGVFSAAGARQTPGVAGFIATGILVAGATKSVSGSATFLGSGALSVITNAIVAGTAVFAGVGSLSAAGSHTAQVRAVVVGTASLSANGVVSVPGPTYETIPQIFSLEYRRRHGKRRIIL